MTAVAACPAATVRFATGGGVNVSAVVAAPVAVVLVADASALRV